MLNCQRSLSVALFLCVVSILTACGKGQQGSGEAPEPEVTVVTIAPKTINLTTTLSGRTTAFLLSEVRPQVGGIVQKRLFKEGGDVKAGEVLYQIDPATYQAAFSNAKAALARAEANALPSKLKAQRYAELVAVNGVSVQENDDAQAVHQQTQADVISARAALDTARINLGYTRVTAPVAGRIGKSSVTPGALVTASQGAALATVQQIDPIYVDVTQSSSELLRLRRALENGTLKRAGADGAKVKLYYEDGSPYPLEGVLQFSDITVDQSTGVVTLRALFPNPKHSLLPGLYVRAVLEEGTDDNALLVPQAAVTRDPKGNPQLLVVKPDNMVELRPISVDRALGGDWLVSSGLAAGERVIVDGLQKAKPGAKVKPLEAKAEPAKSEESQNATRSDTPEKVQKAAPSPKAKQEPASAAKGSHKAISDSPAMAKQQAPVDAPAAEPGQDAASKVPGKPVRGVAYSPPKDQPWPGTSADHNGQAVK
jgi:membrane fusion protein (multidrug efflux system)